MKRRLPQTCRSLFILLSLAGAAFAQQRPWRQVLDERLSIFGHRNWIVVADSAYPLQSAPGIETIVSTDSQVDTMRQVLLELSKRNHLRPVVYVDKELKYVEDQAAPGIAAYRQLLNGLMEKFLAGQTATPLLHEEIISKLDQASKTFNVLIIKTNSLLPYTSLFLELRAGYWDDQAEEHLRRQMP
ncbi:MAG TPA: hypothetical protein VKB79_24420 [Bryobacteraceae bacterium]|nr:hypothetical protein [Bryobacteraceae bacterium]